MKKVLNKRRFSFGTAVALLIAAVSAFSVIYYLINTSPMYFTSDTADTLLWAQASYEAKAIFNSDFSYAALLPFGANLWLVPLVAIFGATMKAQVIGTVIFFIIFSAALIFFFRSMRFSLRNTAYAYFTVVLIMSSSRKLIEIMWEHAIYYSLSLVLIFLVFSLVVRIIEIDFEDYLKMQKKLFACAIPLFILTVLSATDGLQIIATVFFPICGALCLERFFDHREKITFKSSISSAVPLGFVLLSLIFGLISLNIVTSGVTAGYANAFSSFDKSDNWFKNIGSTAKNMFTLFEIDTEYGTEFVSPDALMQIAHIFLVLLLLVAPVILLINYKKLADKKVRLLLWVHILESFVILFGCVFGQLSAANWRLIPMLCTGLLVLICLIRFMGESSSLVVPRLQTVLVFALCVVCLWDLTALYRHQYPENADTTPKDLAVFLEDKGLTCGYADFWNSNVYTVISDGEVAIRPVVLDTPVLKPYHFQSNKRWYTDAQSDDYFLLLTHSQYTDILNAPYWKDLSPKLTGEYSYNADNNPIYCGTYHILVFDENIVTVE